MEFEANKEVEKVDQPKVVEKPTTPQEIEEEFATLGETEGEMLSFLDEWTKGQIREVLDSDTSNPRELARTIVTSLGLRTSSEDFTRMGTILEEHKYAERSPKEKKAFLRKLVRANEDGFKITPEVVRRALTGTRAKRPPTKSEREAKKLFQNDDRFEKEDLAVALDEDEKINTPEYMAGLERLKREGYPITAELVEKLSLEKGSDPEFVEGFLSTVEELKEMARNDGRTFEFTNNFFAILQKEDVVEGRGRTAFMQEIDAREGTINAAALQSIKDEGIRGTRPATREEIDAREE